MPDFLQGYEAVEHELTDEQIVFIRRFYNARTSRLQLEDRRTTTEERNLYNKGESPRRITPENARTYLVWADAYIKEAQLRKITVEQDITKFMRYLTERAK
jgi:hypothetical protein